MCNIDYEICLPIVACGNLLACCNNFGGKTGSLLRCMHANYVGFACAPKALNANTKS